MWIGKIKLSYDWVGYVIQCQCCLRIFSFDASAKTRLILIILGLFSWYIMISNPSEKKNFGIAFSFADEVLGQNEKDKIAPGNKWATSCPTLRENPILRGKQTWRVKPSAFFTNCYLLSGLLVDCGFFQFVVLSTEQLVSFCQAMLIAIRLKMFKLLNVVSSNVS